MAESLDNKIANAIVSWERVPVADYIEEGRFIIWEVRYGYR